MIDAGLLYCPVCRAECRKFKANDVERERRPYAYGFMCPNSLCPIGPFYLTPKFSNELPDPYGEQAKALRQLADRLSDDATLLEDLSATGQRPPRQSIPKPDPYAHLPPWYRQLRRNIDERRRQEGN